MAISWEQKGCAVCRRQWETGRPPPEIAVNCARHSRLHKCNVCSTYWEQLERYADILAESEAKMLYPEAFGKG